MNILPQNIKDEISKGYKMRTFITFFWAAFFILIVCAIIISPSFIIANSKSREVSTRRQTSSQAISEQDEIVNAAHSVNQKVALIMQNIKSASVARRMTQVSGTSSGILIKKISYTKNKIILSGTAANRNSLISFEQQIDKIDFVKNSSVPVGDFAKDRDLAFTMTIDIANE